MTTHDACHTRENGPPPPAVPDQKTKRGQHRSKDIHKHDMRSWRYDMGMELSCFSLEHLVQT